MSSIYTLSLDCQYAFCKMKKAQNKKYYIENRKELKTKAKNNYEAKPEPKMAASRDYSRKRYGLDPEKKKAASKARYSTEDRF